MKHQVILLIFVAVLIPACAAKSPHAAFEQSPQTALEQFYTYDGAEDMLMDPLILAGERVVPLVLEKVRDKNMPRRRYAISFLGNGSYRPALPVLQQILQDETEIDYFRADALESVYKIDESLGKEQARKYLDENNYVGHIAKRIIEGDELLKLRRSYLDAFRGWHD